jgi:hypothetical protein
MVGINTALGISDLLELQVAHFVDEHIHLRNAFGSREGGWVNDKEWLSTRVFGQTWKILGCLFLDGGEGGELYFLQPTNKNDMEYRISV